MGNAIIASTKFDALNQTGIEYTKQTASIDSKTYSYSRPSRPFYNGTAFTFTGRDMYACIGFPSVTLRVDSAHDPSTYASVEATWQIAGSYDASLCVYFNGKSSVTIPSMTFYYKPYLEDINDEITIDAGIGCTGTPTYVIDIIFPGVSNVIATVARIAF